MKVLVLTLLAAKSMQERRNAWAGVGSQSMSLLWALFADWKYSVKRSPKRVLETKRVSGNISLVMMLFFWIWATGRRLLRK